MERPKFLTPKFIECAIRYAVYFLAVALTPFLARPIAPLFDFAGYSLLRPLFVEIFTVLIWAAEGIAIFLVEKKRRKKTLAEAAEGEEPPKKKKGEVKPPIPMKNLLILTGIAIVCIFTVSAVVGFQVKPIYDIGEKVTGYELWNAVGVLGRNLFKCFWILGMIKACKGMADELVRECSLPERKGWTVWLISGGLLFAFGLFDIFTSVVSYPLTTTGILVGLTYILFYAAFTAVYALTEKSEVKSFLLIMLIYLF